MADDYANGRELEIAPPLEAIERGVSLFLDLDGVLANIEPTPDEVVPDKERTERLTRLQKMLEGRVAILSGRTIEDVDRITEKSIALVAGVHGLQSRGFEAEESEPGEKDRVGLALAAAKDFSRSYPLLLIENKDVAVAIHYRDTPNSAYAVKEFADKIARTFGLVRQSGHFVEEVRLGGPNKGDALRRFMTLPEFKATRPIMIGDDRTDEDGFEAADELGGFGIRVNPQGPTLARYRLDSAEHVAAWLDAFLGRK